MNITSRQFVFAFLLALAGPLAAADLWPAGLHRQRDLAERPLTLVEAGQGGDRYPVGSPTARWCAVPQTGSPNSRSARPERPLRYGHWKDSLTAGPHVVALVGDEHPWLRELVAAGRFQIDPRVGEQGYVIRRVRDPQRGDMLMCWSPAELGCRYGLIEILRSLAGRWQDGDRAIWAAWSSGRSFRCGSVTSTSPSICRTRSIPTCCSTCRSNRWSDARMGAVHRHDLGVPLQRVRVLARADAVLAEDALQGGKIPTRVRRDDESGDRLRQVARRRRASDPGGEHDRRVLVLRLPQGSRRSCPDRGLVGPLVQVAARATVPSASFPAIRAAATATAARAETFVDLCLELSQVVRRNQPGTWPIEVGTWGEPMGGWGVPLVDGQAGSGGASHEVPAGQAAGVPARHVHQHQPGLQPRLPAHARRRRQAVRHARQPRPARSDLGLQRHRRRRDGHRRAAACGACSSGAARNRRLAATPAASATRWPPS